MMSQSANTLPRDGSASRPEPAGVGVIGGSGYIGSELLRYLSVHPRVRVRWVTANTKAGEAVADILPNLRGFVEGAFTDGEDAARRLGEVKAVFVALPHNDSQRVIPALSGKAPEVVFIDMGGDFRTNDPDGYRRYYGAEHAARDWLPRFVYGFTEYGRERIARSKLIANPGCFATAINLSLAPLAAAGKLRGNVFVTGITGSSGAGQKPVQTTHHPERATNVRAYKPLAHQHLLEVEAFLRTLTPADFSIHFVPQSGPFVRGIFATVFTPETGVAELEEIFRAAYGREALVSVQRGTPDLRWVQGTVRSIIGVDGEAHRGAVLTVTDNLGKGAAGQAIQNMNLALGFTETDGLLLPGGFV
ncbi:MAG TPA: N-acetyl-gamma-glutamyl-phosphate reductase [Planctomycetota bacterium]|nr:N-acetyl-gamma-glutamyl-phosphate reductase [Planctomycetota bacterium]